ncbi:DNA-directed RNA polymerases I and III 14 kDa polypeptide [Paraphysoderma sedebokerense]|nr:DNA-directed RNA polymerases I and III 14 kDa polypeptide [Paraphysoderma sedebokerense]
MSTSLTDRIMSPSHNQQNMAPATTEDLEMIINMEKISIVNSDDFSCATFCILDEDHTLGNALRYTIMKNPDVEYCGYSLPHPSENKIHLRIQTFGDISAVEALNRGLDDLTEMCQHILQTFAEEVKKGDYEIDM